LDFERFPVCTGNLESRHGFLFRKVVKIESRIFL
jgi:hypothetical protein